MKDKYPTVCGITCQNNGVCVYHETGDRFSCTCPISYCGSRCEHYNTCKNGGRCTYIEPSGYVKCECRKGTSGLKCEKVLVLEKMASGTPPDEDWVSWTTWAVVCVTCIGFVLAIYVCRKKLDLPTILPPVETCISKGCSENAKVSIEEAPVEIVVSVTEASIEIA